MLDIQSLICTKRVTCLKKLLEDYSSPWKTILDKLLFPVGGRFVLHCNFQTSKLKISLPAYYKECFDAWSEVNRKTPSCYEEIINEIIWNNKFLCYDKKSMYRRDIVNLGVVKIKDLISANNSFSCDFSSLTNPEQRFFLMSVYYQFDSRTTPITPTIKMASRNVVPILDINLHRSIKSFCSKSKFRPPQNRNYQTSTQI